MELWHEKSLTRLKKLILSSYRLKRDFISLFNHLTFEGLENDEDKVEPEKIRLKLK